ncbi:hypothetical protein Golax_013572 [Gossypium laxum]|uniref:Uncharacterized protein n=1 Tax=Gossypium laxum TaxID=34288 RepID=A0A7J8ZS23_9ROSI|nr:hypothetical protein [Gossypium laxum]
MQLVLREMGNPYSESLLFSKIIMASLHSKKHWLISWLKSEGTK